MYPFSGQHAVARAPSQVQKCSVPPYTGVGPTPGRPCCTVRAPGSAVGPLGLVLGQHAKLHQTTRCFTNDDPAGDNPSTDEHQLEGPQGLGLLGALQHAFTAAFQHDGTSSTGHLHHTGSSLGTSQLKQQGLAVVTVLTTKYSHPDKRLVLCGAHEQLGHWKPVHGATLALCEVAGQNPVWAATLHIPLDDLIAGIEAKLAYIKDEAAAGAAASTERPVSSRGYATWEDGGNRVIKLSTERSSTHEYVLQLEWCRTSRTRPVQPAAAADSTMPHLLPQQPMPADNTKPTDKHTSSPSPPTSSASPAPIPPASPIPTPTPAPALRHPPPPAPPPAPETMVAIAVWDPPQLKPGQQLLMLGAHPAMGSWRPAAGVQLIMPETNGLPCAMGSVKLPMNSTVEAKMVIMDPLPDPALQKNVSSQQARSSFNLNRSLTEISGQTATPTTSVVSGSLGSVPATLKAVPSHGRGKQVVDATPRAQAEKHGPREDATPGVRWEPGPNRKLQVAAGHSCLLVCEWGITHVSEATMDAVRCRFHVPNKRVPPGCWMGLLADDQTHGLHAPTRVLPLNWQFGNNWEAWQDLPQSLLQRGMAIQLVICKNMHADEGRDSAKHFTVQSEVEPGPVRHIQVLDPNVFMVSISMQWGQQSSTKVQVAARAGSNEHPSSPATTSGGSLSSLKPWKRSRSSSPARFQMTLQAANAPSGHKNSPAAASHGNSGPQQQRTASSSDTGKYPDWQMAWVPLTDVPATSVNDVLGSHAGRSMSVDGSTLQQAMSSDAYNVVASTAPFKTPPGAVVAPSMRSPSPAAPKPRLDVRIRQAISSIVIPAVKAIKAPEQVPQVDAAATAHEAATAAAAAAASLARRARRRSHASSKPRIVQQLLEQQRAVQDKLRQERMSDDDDYRQPPPPNTPADSGDAEQQSGHMQGFISRLSRSQSPSCTPSPPAVQSGCTEVNPPAASMPTPSPTPISKAAVQGADAYPTAAQTSTSPAVQRPPAPSLQGVADVAWATTTLQAVADTIAARQDGGASVATPLGQHASSSETNFPAGDDHSATPAAPQGEQHNAGSGLRAAGNGMPGSSVPASPMDTTRSSLPYSSPSPPPRPDGPFPGLRVDPTSDPSPAPRPHGPFPELHVDPTTMARAELNFASPDTHLPSLPLDSHYKTRHKSSYSNSYNKGSEGTGGSAGTQKQPTVSNNVVPAGVRTRTGALDVHRTSLHVCSMRSPSPRPMSSPSPSGYPPIMLTSHQRGVATNSRRVPPLEVHAMRQVSASSIPPGSMQHMQAGAGSMQQLQAEAGSMQHMQAEAGSMQQLHTGADGMSVAHALETSSTVQGSVRQHVSVASAAMDEADGVTPMVSSDVVVQSVESDVPTVATEAHASALNALLSTRSPDIVPAAAPASGRTSMPQKAASAKISRRIKNSSSKQAKSMTSTLKPSDIQMTIAAEGEAGGVPSKPSNGPSKATQQHAAGAHQGLVAAAMTLASSMDAGCVDAAAVSVASDSPSAPAGPRSTRSRAGTANATSPRRRAQRKPQQQPPPPPTGGFEHRP